MIDNELAELPTQEITRHMGAASRHALTGLATRASRQADRSAAEARDAAQRVRTRTDLARAVNPRAEEAVAEGIAQSDGAVEIPEMTDRARDSHNLAEFEYGAHAVALDHDDLGVGTITDIDISADDVTYTVTFLGNDGDDITIDLDGHELHILTQEPPSQHPGHGQILDRDGIRDMTDEERAEHTLTHGEPGTRVRARDRGNLGTITDIDDDKGTVTVHFRNEDGHEATIDFQPHQLDVLNPSRRTITPPTTDHDDQVDPAPGPSVGNPSVRAGQAAEARSGPGIGNAAAAQKLARDGQSRWTDTHHDPANVAARHLHAARDLAHRWQGRWADSRTANDPTPGKTRHQHERRDELGR